MRGVKTNTGTYCGHQMPTPNSETEEVGYEVKHLEPLRCQEYEDEIRALLEALGRIADQQDWIFNETVCYDRCSWCSVSRDSDHFEDCLFEIARTALAKGD